jgi:uncharacterized membrane protein
MGNEKQSAKASTQSNKKIKNIFISVGSIVILIAAILIIKASIGGGGGSQTVTASGDLYIPKSEITETAKFYTYNANGTKLEILAVKASDGTIRTAFNTCQVCNGSPRAYYKQQGDVLVCQNCGNMFAMDMIEQQRGGCNPIPIMKDEKTDDGSNIIISEDFIVKNKNLFTANWKTQ